MTGEIKKHLTKKWEISIIEVLDNEEKKYKVTRKYPDLTVAETKIFKSKEEARKQFEKWPNY